MNREILLDVTRLIWRAWRGRRPTGIDRVCLAYAGHFAGRAQAVIHRRGFTMVLSARSSDRLIRLFDADSPPARWRLLVTIASALAAARPSPPRSGMIYLNVGHTALNDPSMPRWIGRSHVRAVYLIHDLIPLTHPEHCRPGEGERHARRMENALRSAAGIIANSQDTLRILEEFAANIGQRMPPGLVAWISGPDPLQQVAPRSLSRPYFVTVGTIESRKNHLMLVRIWDDLVKRMGGKAPILVILGQRGWEAAEAIARLHDLGPLRDHVVEIPSSTDAELASWIAGARALLMPSAVEGFGLPVIEALGIGTPVIANDLPVYRETVGDIPTYIDPSDLAAWRRAITGFMDGDGERDRQLSRIATYRPPTWPDHFRKVEAWLSTLPGPDAQTGTNAT